MKTKQTITVEVEINLTDKEAFALFVGYMSEKAKAAHWSECTFYAALAHLDGRDIDEAVSAANNRAKFADEITVAEFCEWLPCMISAWAREVVG